MINNREDLEEWFNKNEKRYFKLEESDLSSSDEKYIDEVKQILLNFARINYSIQKLSIFSNNEEFDDIKTEDLKFLLTQYYLGKIILQVNETRLKNLKQSIVNLPFNKKEIFYNLF
jgi:immunoglobulin-binding protein 1